jgi:hypothetical protein
VSTTEIFTADQNLKYRAKLLLQNVSKPMQVWDWRGGGGGGCQTEESGPNYNEQFSATALTSGKITLRLVLM